VSARVDVLGVGFDRLDLTGAAVRIAERYAAGQRTFGRLGGMLDGEALGLLLIGKDYGNVVAAEA